jgi:hypothetical protein
MIQITGNKVNGKPLVIDHGPQQHVPLLYAMEKTSGEGEQRTTKESQSVFSQ